MTLLITEKDAAGLLSLESAIPVIEDMFRMAGRRETENPARFRMPLKKGTLQFRAAALHGSDVVGFKVSSHFPKHRRMWNFLYSSASGECLAIVQSHAITTLRTSAATAVAAKHLSPPDVEVVGMYGAGFQAQTQLAAVCAVRRVKAAYVYSRDAVKREAFCRMMSERLRVDVIPAATAPEVAHEARIIVVITNSDTPVLSGDWITRPLLVIGVGANQWYRREVDEKLVTRAARIVVDEKENAKVECGDLLWAVAHGLLRWDQVDELGDIVARRIPAPDFAADIVLYESQGIAVEDVAITARAYELARASGVGTEIDL